MYFSFDTDMRVQNSAHGHNADELSLAAKGLGTTIAKLQDMSATLCCIHGQKELAFCSMTKHYVRHCIQHEGRCRFE